MWNNRFPFQGQQQPQGNVGQFGGGFGFGQGFLPNQQANFGQFQAQQPPHPFQGSLNNLQQFQPRFPPQGAFQQGGFQPRFGGHGFGNNFPPLPMPQEQQQQKLGYPLNPQFPPSAPPLPPNQPPLPPSAPGSTTNPAESKEATAFSSNAQQMGARPGAFSSSDPDLNRPGSSLSNQSVAKSSVTGFSSGEQESGQNQRGPGSLVGQTDKQLEDWHCLKCQTPNFSFRNVCKTCGVAKEEAAFKPQAASANFSNNANKQPAKPPFMKKDTDWKCSSCNNINYEFRKECFRCKLPKQTKTENVTETNQSIIAQNSALTMQVPPPTAPPAAIKNLPFNQQPGNWNCSSCKNINFAHRTFCNRCKLPRIAAEAKPITPGAPPPAPTSQKPLQSLAGLPPDTSLKSLPESDKPNLSNQEIEFDKMFEKWELQFEEWKAENQHNPDKEFVANHIENMNAFREKLKQRRENLRKQRMADQQENNQKQFSVPPPASKPNQQKPLFSNPPPVTPQFGNQGQWKKDQQNKSSSTQDQQPGTGQSFSGFSSSGLPSFLGQSGTLNTSGIPGFGTDDEEQIPTSNQINDDYNKNEDYENYDEENRDGGGEDEMDPDEAWALKQAERDAAFERANKESMPEASGWNYQQSFRDLNPPEKSMMYGQNRNDWNQRNFDAPNQWNLREDEPVVDLFERRQPQEHQNLFERVSRFETQDLFERRRSPERLNFDRPGPPANKPINSGLVIDYGHGGGSSSQQEMEQRTYNRERSRSPIIPSSSISVPKIDNLENLTEFLRRGRDSEPTSSGRRTDDRYPDRSTTTDRYSDRRADVAARGRRSNEEPHFRRSPENRSLNNRDYPKPEHSYERLDRVDERFGGGSHDDRSRSHKRERSPLPLDRPGNRIGDLRDKIRNRTRINPESRGHDKDEPPRKDFRRTTESFPNRTQKFPDVESRPGRHQDSRQNNDHQSDVRTNEPRPNYPHHHLNLPLVEQFEEVSPPPPPQPQLPTQRNKVVSYEDLTQPPGRFFRPPKLVIIMRGLPGSGKTHIARNIKSTETEQGFEAPRILALDDYFECDGKYIYEEEMEETYRSSFVRSFKKQIDDGYFPFIIVDAINNKTKHYEEMWSYAMQKGFEVYICEMDETNVMNCAAKNVHERTAEEISRLKKNWDSTPAHFNILDLKTFLQDKEIDNVEMADADCDDSKSSNEKKINKVLSESEDSSEEISSDNPFKLSKWEVMDDEQKMARLDGLSEKAKKKLSDHKTIEDWLELPEDSNPLDKKGKRRVRWADIEERQTQMRMRDVGFIVGQTNWDRMLDPTGGGSALTKTKIIPNRFQNS